MRDFIIKQIQQKFPAQFDLRKGGFATVDITKEGVDKKKALLHLITTLGWENKNIVYFGDFRPGGNESPVLQVRDITVGAVGKTFSPAEMAPGVEVKWIKGGGSEATIELFGKILQAIQK